jgi:hypothetical protein
LIFIHRKVYFQIGYRNFEGGNNTNAGVRAS